MGDDDLVQVRIPDTVYGSVMRSEMGVLPDGTPYLTGRALARVCGQAPSTILQLTADWATERFKPRGRKIATLLAEFGYRGAHLYTVVQQDSGSVNAHPDSVCMAILEYYVYEKGNETARAAHRLLTRYGLREIILNAVGRPEAVPERWRHYHARMELNVAPAGYFSIFKETGEIVLAGIRLELQVDSETVPDGSVGIMWARHWRDTGGDERHGERRRHEHVYPPYFPQAAAEIQAWVYPNAALGEFRDWLEKQYLPVNFPAYLKKKVKALKIEADNATRLIAAVVKPQLE